MTAKRKSEEEVTEVPTLPTKPAATPIAAVPTPKPAPAAVTAPHLCAGVVADVKTYGSAIDPFTGKTVLPADLA